MTISFKEYPKVHSLLDSGWNFREEVDWILDWLCYIQEKIDWANLSVWLEDWEIFVWSRRTVVGTDKIKEWFRGAVEYINTHKGIRRLLDTLEWDIRLYWEWLVPHTITDYNSLSYNHFYLFDVEVDGVRKTPEKVFEFAETFWIKTPEIFWVYKNPSVEDIQQFVWQTTLKENNTGWEWIVIKNLDFINKWWRGSYAKIVSENFKEENWVVFGNHQRWDTEMLLTNKYCVVGRVRKIINKIEQQQDKDISKQDIKQIIWRLQNDIITEEARNISKKWLINFKRLKGLIGKRGARITIDIIEWNEESVAFGNEA